MARRLQERADGQRKGNRQEATGEGAEATAAPGNGMIDYDAILPAALNKYACERTSITISRRDGKYRAGTGPLHRTLHEAMANLQECVGLATGCEDPVIGLQAEIRELKAANERLSQENRAVLMLAGAWSLRRTNV